MKIEALNQIPVLEKILPGNPDATLVDGYASDLLSDVMANAPAGAVLITIQAHRNTVATASLMDLPAIIICNGRSIPEEMLSAAKQEQIALFQTPENQFQTAVRLARLLVSQTA
jgi:hypothetical protein